MNDLERITKLLSSEKLKEHHDEIVKLLKHPESREEFAVLRRLLSITDLQARHTAILNLVRIWSSQGWDKGVSGSSAPQVTPRQSQAQKYVFEYAFFAYKQLPFEFWSDIAEEALKLLEKMIEDGDLNYLYRPEYEKLNDLMSRRVREIRTDPKYVGYHDVFDEMGM